MYEVLALLLMGLAVIPVIAARKAKEQQEQQRQQQMRKAQTPQPQKPDTLLPPREQKTHQSRLQPTLHDHSGMFDGSLFADDGTEGSDPHDHGFDHEVDMPSDHSDEVINRSLTAKPAAASPARTPVLDFSPRNIASAFVLQEVLRRRNRA